MRKTLKSLRELALERTEKSLQEFESFSQEYKKWAKKALKKDVEIGSLALGAAKFFAKSVKLNGALLEAILSLTMYVKSLKDYSLELDEAWDELLERSRKAQEQSQVVKKEEKKKPSYRV